MACSQLSNNKYQETLNLTLNDTTDRNLVKEKAFDWDYISVTSTNITFYIEIHRSPEFSSSLLPTIVSVEGL